MFEFIKTRLHQGYQAIPNVRTRAVKAPFRGFPLIPADSPCPSGCGACKGVCPTGALGGTDKLTIDLGRCTFCGDCQQACPAQMVQFSNYHWLATDDREKLKIQAGTTPDQWRRDAIAIRRELHSLFGRSFKLRQVSAAGCNGCELELNACGNVNFDMGRFGIEFVASPRHADAVLVTGPISQNMAYALNETWEATPAPKLLILAGTCAISGGVFQNGTLDRSFLSTHKPDLYLPGCPIHPLTVVNGLLDLLTTRGRS
jgi:Ni,Fe-hydrogenase III small subunit/ferredoxin